MEHVWDMLGRRIAARQPPPTCLPELRRALLVEWCNIPQDKIDNLILSMPRRFPCRNCEMEIEVVSPPIVSSGNFTELNRTVTCMVLKTNDRRTSSPLPR
ncbi:transposable element Tcb1 transposase [Trichonephila clavipes]|nr:transposable element Tcb1 transposase [Trichonephila clavipes]